MSVPINEHDYDRFLKLANLLSKTEGEISIYIGDNGYVSLELKTKSADVNAVREIIGAKSPVNLGL
jgi:hypothetical protein